VDRAGNVVARTTEKFSHPPYQPEPGYAEQNAAAWWETAKSCLQRLTAAVADAQIIAISVDSTSGTFVPVDEQGAPLMPALMYNDGRAAGLDAEVNDAAYEFIDAYGYAFPPSFSLVKILWLKRHRPHVFAQAARLLHAADFLVGNLTGNFDITDTSNALKSGVDPLTGEWPAFIPERLGLPLDLFPRVFYPGEKVGEVSARAAELTGLPPGASVIAGASDGTASFLASGAKAVGDWNITIGSTIAMRGVSDALIRDPLGRFYCHRHPDGHWLPGGASNVGGEALTKVFQGDRLTTLDGLAFDRLPTPLLIYPLVRQGERMPFVSANAEGFVVGMAGSESTLFAAYAEAIALVAAWSVMEAQALGAPGSGEYFLSGGASHGKTLALALASVLDRLISIPAEPEAAFGSALLAAAWAWYDGVSAAQAAMIHRAEVVAPDLSLTGPLRNKLKELQEECLKRGYLS
jgi:xylulokinase